MFFALVLQKHIPLQAFDMTLQLMDHPALVCSSDSLIMGNVGGK